MVLNTAEVPREQIDSAIIQSHNRASRARISKWSAAQFGLIIGFGARALSLDTAHNGDSEL